MYALNTTYAFANGAIIETQSVELLPLQPLIW